MLRIPAKLLASLALFVSILAAWYATRIDLAQFVSDDGGIYLRYAERLAQGKGFNYNDGQSVNGASCALYTLLLAGLLRLGLTPATAIAVIAVPAFAATAGLLFWTFARYWSLFAAVFCLAACASVEFLFDYVFDALEPTFVMMLAAALFHALHTQSRVYQGVVLGLLVANKLDGAFAAVAFALVFVVTQRAFPLRVALIALAAAAPVLLFLLVRFGSIFPQSASTKIFGASTLGRAPFNPLWVCETFAILLPLFYLPALLSYLIPAERPNGLARLTIQAWCLLHVLAYSVIDLGAPFPWYCSLPAFLIVLLATISADTLYQAAQPHVAEADSGRLRWQRTALRALPLVLLGVFFWIHCWPVIRGRLPRPDGSPRLMSSSASEIGRSAIGAWLRKHTSGTEFLSTAYGLPAFEYKGPIHDIAQLNSRPDPAILERVRYGIDGPFASGRTPRATDDEGFDLVGTFQYGADAELYALYARHDSEVARANLCHVRLALLAGPPTDATTRAPATAERFAVSRGNLFARLPCDLSFTIRAPCPPSFAITPEVRSHPGRAERVDVRIRINDVEIDARTLTAGEAGTRRVLQASAEDPEGAYRLELSARVAGADPGDLWVMWGQPQAWAGEPLEPSDFTLTCAAWERRIEEAERVAER